MAGCSRTSIRKPRACRGETGKRDSDRGVAWLCNRVGVIGSGAESLLATGTGGRSDGYLRAATKKFCAHVEICKT